LNHCVCFPCLGRRSHYMARVDSFLLACEFGVPLRSSVEFIIS